MDIEVRTPALSHTRTLILSYLATMRTTAHHDLLSDPITNYPAATVACFDPTTGELPRRGLDEERTVAFLEKLAAAGAPAVLIAASTGQGHA
jgi:hypothetical protein